MPTLIGTITRAATRRQGEPLNILTFPTHEAYQTGLALTGHNFYLLQGPGIKTWNTKFRPVPANHLLLDAAKGNRQIPAEVDFDLVLSQNKFGQYQVALQIASQLHLPMVSLEHTLPMREWGAGELKKMKRWRGDINVFISEYSRQQWGWNEEEAQVVHHGIDTNVFRPGDEPRKSHALSVVNDWVNRDYFCGYSLWAEATQGLPVRVLGDTPGLSKPAESVALLAREYRSSLVFINTSLVSPIPTALLEAMASGCGVVSTSNCMIGSVIRHGENGLLADTPAAIRSCVERLLARPEEAMSLGRKARETVLGLFSMNRFIESWNEVFYQAASLIYTGETV